MRAIWFGALGAIVRALRVFRYGACISAVYVSKFLFRNGVRIGIAATVASVSVIVLIAGTEQTHATIDTGATPLQLAQAIASDPGIVTGAAYVAVPGGTPNAVSDTPLTAFPTNGSTYAILSTGSALLAPTANTSPSSGADDGGGNVRGNTDFDVTILRIDLSIPSGINCLVGVDFRFLSEEYPEFVGSTFNDAFVAELDSSTWTTSGSTISAPNNFAFDPSHSEITVNAAGVTSMRAANATGTTYDGATPRLMAKTPISPGTHSLYLSIFDQGDHIFDSAVFIDNLRVGTVDNVSTDCQPGATVVGSVGGIAELPDIAVAAQSQSEGLKNSDSGWRWPIVVLAAAGVLALGGYGALRLRSKRSR
jgi:hypothetical protein